MYRGEINICHKTRNFSFIFTKEKFLLLGGDVPLKNNDKVDRLLDMVIMLLTSGFISWVIGRFEIFPLYETLDFYFFKCSTGLVAIICILFDYGYLSF